MKSKLSFEEIASDYPTLCKYCECTEYGRFMGMQEPSDVSYGCEGEFCKEAYQNYLDYEED